MEKISTTNFYFAAALISKGYSISHIDRSDCKHIKFEFSTVPEILNIQKQWDEKSLMINAREFAEAIREIKMKIHQE